MSTIRRPEVAFAVAVVLFLAASLPAKLLLASAPPWLAHAVTKGLMVAFAVGGMALAGGGPARWGFTRAVDARWGLVIARGLALGAAATGLILLLGGGGVPMAQKLGGLGGIILHIWIISSVCEEIFVRGWFQGWVAPRRAQPYAIGPWSVPPRALYGALLFGAMHLSLFFSGADLATVVVVVAAATTLGLFAGLDRERSGSLGPPIATHIAFNVGGLAAGIVFVIIRMRTGH